LGPVFRVRRDIYAAAVGFDHLIDDVESQSEAVTATSLGTLLKRVEQRW
jgi:hypothetical protein